MTKPVKNRVSDFMHWFGLVMIASYFALGIYVYFSDDLFYIEKNIRIIFGLFLFAFGFFRLVNWFQKHKTRRFFGGDDD
jgi:hypothetical protein